MLRIFDLYYQDLAKEVTWIDEQPYYEDDLELYNAITDTADIEWIEDAKPLSTKKRVRVYEQDDTSIKLFKTTDYVNRAESYADSMDTDLSPDQSAWSSVRSSA